MRKLLATGKTDLLQFVSSRTRRPFAAYLVRQPDGKIGFEFEARKDGAGKPLRGGRGAAALRVLGKHPKDKQPVELHAGRYGPYVKHGGVNATLPDRDKIDALTLDEAVALLAEKSGKGARVRRAKTPKNSRPAAAVSTKRPAAISAKPLAKAPRTAKASPRAATRKRAT
jgi:topoisomerase IA-like protein